MDKDLIIEQVKRWVSDFVIQYNVCPFAKKVFVQDRIKYSISPATEPEQILQDFLVELQMLEQVDAQEMDTTLLILPQSLSKFEDYLDFIQIAEGFMMVLGHEGVFQLATFHPDYQFEGTEASDAENFTNRSPYPIIHILREDSIEKAIENHPDPEGIPDINIHKMNNLGANKLQELFNSFLIKE